MNIIENYYIRKASRGVQDDYHNRIEDGDLDLLRKSRFYLFLTPTLTFGVVYLGYQLKNQVLMSQHFYYIIKKMQEKF